MHTLYALDLTARKETDSVWRRSQIRSGHRTPDSAPGTSHPDLPIDGFASTFGFWFAPAPSWKIAAPDRRVEFVTLEETDGLTPRRDDPPTRTSTTRRAVRPGQSGSAAGSRPGRSGPPLRLEIDANVARIRVDADTWSRVGEIVLFAVAQYWRFAAINRTLNDLSDWSRHDLACNSSFLSLIPRARSRQLRARRRTLQAVILDLPLFEGALTNPHGHLPTSRDVRLYRKLCRWLGLGRFRREIDERIEVVESVFDSLSESLDHCQSLAFQIALELIIVAVLLVDVGLYFVDAFSK
jgi:hypothetical protein